MATLGDVMRLSPRIEQGAIDYYERRETATETSERGPAAAPTTTKRATGVPPRLRGVHPLILARAARESGGDWARCVADADGSITVHNHVLQAPREDKAEGGAA